jgi:hypothetical protein
MTDALATYRSKRDNLLLSVDQALSRDDRFVAAWITGSLAHGNADSVSDLDLTLVVSPTHSDILCRRIEQVSSQTTPERLELFSQFGTPAILHENNNNAPDGGSFTFVLYSSSATMVDWILVPQAVAQRPFHAKVLFEKNSIPVQPPKEPESLEDRAKKASELAAFFWMMMAITSKYILRHDQEFVTCWLEELHKTLREVERLVAGQAWEYKRGSLSSLEPDRSGQKQAVLRLGKRMENMLPELARMGGKVYPSPMPEINLLLDLASDKHVESQP